MALPRPRFLSCVLAAGLVIPSPAAAFDTPLSDTAVREAYFLGQRRGEAMAKFLEKYTKHPPPPKSGPYVSSIAFFTPYALVAQLSSRSTNYSAQQAEIDHRDLGEYVEVVVQFEYMDPNATQSANGTFRVTAFWKDYDFQILDGEDVLRPFTSSAEPNYICSEDGGCLVTGATLTFDLAPEFASDTATVRVTPPEGDPLSVDFDLSALR